jgi:signal transduction histidine kinase
VQSAVRHGETLVESIATIARDQPLEYELVDVNRSVENVADFLRAALPPSVGLTIETRAQVGEALLLRGSLERVLLNAVFNAAQAMPDGGTIVVSTSNEVTVGIDGDHARDSREAAQLFVVVRVVDDGVGLDPEIGERAFEPGFTTRAPGVRHGLGLSTCRQLVQACSGSLELTGAPGAGSTLTFRYPCVSRAAVR